MKVTFNTADSKLSITAEGDTQKDIFKQLAELQEVFDNLQCGVCGGANVRFVVRTVDDNNFYELHCLKRDCRAKLAFGQHKKGGSLFPKRKGEDDQYLKNNGWVKWNPEAKKEE